jgi:hypothetical protein
MNELVFTNLRWPKVTPYQERWDTAGWALFTETWPPGMETLIIIRQGMTAGTELFLSGGRFRRKCCWTRRAGTDAQGFIEESLWADSPEDSGDEWTRHEESHF